MSAMTTEERHRHYADVIHPQLNQLARLICEATGIEDEVLADSRYQDLLAFYEEQVGRGCWHPALTESVADFTAVRDPAGALPYYRLALEQARLLKASTYTILISMAEALFELRQKEQAEACLRDGRAEAATQGDDYCVREADRMLRERSD
jgi:hypothetical protein